LVPDKLSHLDAETPLLDAVLQRARTSGVRTSDQDGKFTRVDRDAALRALHEDLQRALSDDEVEAPPAVKSAAAACQGVLRRLFRPGAASAILPSQLPDMTEQQRTPV
jgi:hypothetical protein